MDKSYRWCPGCGVLIDDVLVFCSEQCSDAYFAAPVGLQGEGFSVDELGRLEFSKWLVGQGRLGRGDLSVAVR